MESRNKVNGGEIMFGSEKQKIFEKEMEGRMQFIITAFQKQSERMDGLESRIEIMETILKNELKDKGAEPPKAYRATISGFSTGEDYEHLHKICEEISGKDMTFMFAGNPDALEIEIFSSDKDKLHQKAMWLIKKTNIEGLKYKVE
jgi:hypothetical protein